MAKGRRALKDRRGGRIGAEGGRLSLTEAFEDRGSLGKARCASEWSSAEDMVFWFWFWFWEEALKAQRER
jgi:hypothetical protein